jgi:2-hydroxychromene-2-carboxylate isomerase
MAPARGFKRMAKLQFWYDLASSYSYLTAMRIDALAAAAEVEVEWKPFLLGPIFAAQGWNTSPFNLYPAKGRYMVRDMERLCAERGLPFILPEPFPQNSLLAARLALIGEAEGWAASFSRAVFRRQFGEGSSLQDQVMLTAALADAGLEVNEQIRRTSTPEIKQLLITRGEEAQVLGIFGAPTFITEDGELFWGDDRLQQAFAWSAKD